MWAWEPERSRGASRSPPSPHPPCSLICAAHAAEHCRTAPAAAPWLCIRDATLTASPCIVYLRPPCAPTTFPHTPRRSASPRVSRLSPAPATARPRRSRRRPPEHRGRSGTAARRGSCLFGGDVCRRDVAPVDDVDSLDAVDMGEPVELAEEPPQHVEEHFGIHGAVERAVDVDVVFANAGHYLRPCIIATATEAGKCSTRMPLALEHRRSDTHDTHRRSDCSLAPALINASAITLFFCCIVLQQKKCCITSRCPTVFSHMHGCGRQRLTQSDESRRTPYK